MSDVKIYTQADFPPILKWQAIAFMKTEWPGIFQGPLKFLTEPYPPQLNPVHFALCHDDALISYATVMHQTLTHAGQQFDAGCFGNMFTCPPYRHEGHALKVLQAATDYVHQSGADVAALFCKEQLTSFYAQCGWEAMQAPTHVGTPQKYEIKEAPRMMLFVSAKGQAARQSFAEEALLVDWAW